MVVDDTHVMSVAAVPPEDDTPLLVDSYAVEAFQTTLQRLQAIPAGRGHVSKAPSRIEHVESSNCRTDNLWREPSRLLAFAGMEQSFRRPVAERSYHAIPLFSVGGIISM
jgi:hypothetical protein